MQLIRLTFFTRVTTFWATLLGQLAILRLL